MPESSPTPIPDPNSCPDCGRKGWKVGRITLESLLTPDAARRIGEGQYRFCETPDCRTVYFDSHGSVFAKSDLTVRVGIKEYDAPRHVCYCFDHTIEEIEAEVRETGTSTVLDDIKTRMKTVCWCETKSPRGSCCLGTVSKQVKIALAAHGEADQANAPDEEHADCCAGGGHAATASASVNAADRRQSAPNDGAAASGRGKTVLAVGGSMLSALAASACCWIPLMLLVFGVSAGGVSAWFEQYRLLFLSLTAAFLGAGFYFAYFHKPHCEPGSACATPSRKLQRWNRAMLWVATGVVIITAAFPKYVGYLMPGDAGDQIAISSERVATASLGIKGMTCEACTIHVRTALLDVPGVLGASVSYPDGTATISFEKTTPPAEADLLEAVAGTGYSAEMSGGSDSSGTEGP